MKPILASLTYCSFLLIRCTRAINNDFSAYPQDSQSCLYDAADESNCTGNTGQELNECLCTNQGNFIYNTAQCVAKKSPSDLKTVYATLENNCKGTSVTLVVSESAFMAQASAATASTSSPTATSTTSPTSTSTSTSSASDGLAQGAKIGIGVGAGSAIVAAIIAGIFLWRRQRRRRGAPTNSAYNPTIPIEYSPYGQQIGLAPSAAQSPHPGVGTELGAIQYNLPVSPAHTATHDYYGAQNDDNTGKISSGQPLLAELGNTEPQYPPAAELYANASVELPADYGHGQTHPPHGGSGQHINRGTNGDGNI